MKKNILEICVTSMESAINAAAGGADRIELCSALNEGGTTPSSGMIKAVVKELNIPVYVLIRPRGGSFCYTKQEIKIMVHDIEICKDSGVAGIVTGALLANNNVDRQTCNLLVESAKPLTCTFHRAFDVAADPFTALEDIIEIGFVRLLTSGQKPTAEEGLVLISQLSRVAGDRIIIMPGAGINETNIEKIACHCGAKEFHMSLRTEKRSSGKLESMLHSPSEMVTDKNAVRRVKEILQGLK
jgi:copper homeostasis protein